MASLCHSVGRRGQRKAGWMKSLIRLTQAGRTQSRDLAGPSSSHNHRPSNAKEPQDDARRWLRSLKLSSLIPPTQDTLLTCLIHLSQSPTVQIPTLAHKALSPPSRPSFPTPPAVGISKGSQEVVPARSVADTPLSQSQKALLPLPRLRLLPNKFPPNRLDPPP